MMASPIYLKHEISIKDLSAQYNADPRVSLTNKWLFVGIDMAPIDNLETGVAVLDRNKRVLRMEKLNEDAELLQFLENLSRSENIIVALDIPKSLNIPSKWRQQQIKMHPLRLNEQPDYISPEQVPTERFAQRAKDFYDAVEKKGILIFGFFTAHAKMRYALNIPFRNRSPQGCRSLQAALRQRLALKDVPTNLAPSSVLDAMIGAYTGWLLCNGKESEHFRLYHDDEKRLYMDPIKRPRLLKARR
jgi:hypothetical protein